MNYNLLSQLRNAEVVNEKDDGYESRVVYHSKLDISRTTPIQQRKYYIDGCGQPCKHCFHLIKETENVN